MSDFKPERFFWCETCRSVSYRFECCGATVCNGAGCEKCGEMIGLFGAAVEYCRETGEEPGVETVARILSLDDDDEKEVVIDEDLTEELRESIEQANRGELLNWDDVKSSLFLEGKTREHNSSLEEL